MQVVPQNIRGAFLAVAFAVGFVSSVKADVVLSNLSSPTTFSIYLGGGGYIAFTAANARLNSISFVLAPGNSEPTAPLTVSIYSYVDLANAANAGTKLITLSPTDQEPFSDTNQVVTYTPLSEFIFAADTNYVLGVESSDTSSYNLPFADDTPVGSPGWAYVPHGNGLVTGGMDGIAWGPSLPFQIDATAVPEPSTWALAGIGMMGAFVAVRRRKSAA